MWGKLCCSVIQKFWRLYKVNICKKWITRCKMTVSNRCKSAFYQNEHLLFLWTFTFNTWQILLLLLSLHHLFLPICKGITFIYLKPKGTRKIRGVATIQSCSAEHMHMCILEIITTELKTKHEFNKQKMNLGH